MIAVDLNIELKLSSWGLEKTSTEDVHSTRLKENWSMSIIFSYRFQYSFVSR